MSSEHNFVICAADCCTIPILQQPIAKLFGRVKPVCESLIGQPAGRKAVSSGVQQRSVLGHSRPFVRAL